MRRRTSDNDLLASGDPHSFAEFYDRHAPALTIYFSRRTASSELAFDLVAETFARALEHRNQFDSKRGPAAGWLYGIARNLLADSLREARVSNEARRRLGMPPIALDDDAITQLEQHASLDLTEALRSIPAEHRDAVWQRIVEEDSYAEMAKQLGVSEQLVRQRVSRGLTGLRRTLERGL